MATKSQGVRFDAFVENARPDPKSTEKLVLLQGYIGKSDLNGHIRVYSDPELSDFIELPEKDICYADPISTEEDPLGGSRLWVRKTTVFTAGNPNQANRVKSSFLEGDIMRAFGDTVNIPTVVLPIVAPTIVGAICHATSKPKSCCDTKFGSPCLQTQFQPSCLRTCHQPSCFQTCHQPSCFQTCFQPSCERTCHQPSCEMTCFQLSCEMTCHQPMCNIPSRTCHQSAQVCQTPPPPLSLGCTFGGDCTARTICMQIAPLTNPGVTYPGYTGGFNPYQTGY
ncbi:MAG: hypothetical protein H7246_14145 [Phycisphaerae bacterium]|nr:hypothetical protein [Saprospiraceae bacterium]